MDVVVLAGGRCPDDLRLASGCEFRADLPFGEGRLVDVVIRAAQQYFGSDARVLLVGSRADNAISLPAGTTFLESLYLGIEQCSGPNAMIATADLPFVDSSTIAEFLPKCDLNAAINWPIVDVRLCQTAFPGMKRTTLKLREGRFTGGNMALIHLERFQRLFSEIERAYRNRKSPFRLAGQIGPMVMLRVLLGQMLPFTLSVAGLEKSLERAFGEPVKAVICDHPEIATDVDNLDQYRCALEMLAKRNG